MYKICGNMRYCCKLYEYASNSIRNGIVFNNFNYYYSKKYIIEIEIYTIQKFITLWGLVWFYINSVNE